MIQIMPNCKNYKYNDNPNLTCCGKKRCVLWSDEVYCYEFKDKKESDSF